MHCCCFACTVLFKMSLQSDKIGQVESTAMWDKYFKFRNSVIGLILHYYYSFFFKYFDIPNMPKVIQLQMLDQTNLEAHIRCFCAKISLYNNNPWFLSVCLQQGQQSLHPHSVLVQYSLANRDCGSAVDICWSES